MLGAEREWRGVPAAWSISDGLGDELDDLRHHGQTQVAVLGQALLVSRGLGLPRPNSESGRLAVGSFEEGAAHPAYDAAGVDRSLIRWMLSLTPSERLRYVQGTID